MNSQAAEIAKGLTALQRQIVIGLGEVLGMPYAASVVRPLIRLGLFEPVVRKGFQTRWHPTAACLAVRTYLENSNG